jgi:endonuclease/exonuclease/phosphatase family metal-dependent hydrolase
VHPVPPIGQTLYWRTGMDNQIPASAPGPPRVLAGDFNATLDHAALRAVLETGYRDAADCVGAGLTPTWPFYGPRSLITPKVTLDHVLVPTGIGVRDFRAVTIPRSDHRAIVATLLVP